MERACHNSQIAYKPTLQNFAIRVLQTFPHNQYHIRGDIPSRSSQEFHPNILPHSQNGFKNPSKEDIECVLEVQPRSSPQYCRLIHCPQLDVLRGPCSNDRRPNIPLARPNPSLDPVLSPLPLCSGFRLRLAILSLLENWL